MKGFLSEELSSTDMIKALIIMGLHKNYKFTFKLNDNIYMKTLKNFSPRSTYNATFFMPTGSGISAGN